MKLLLMLLLRHIGEIVKELRMYWHIRHWNRIVHVTHHWITHHLWIHHPQLISFHWVLIPIMLVVIRVPIVLQRQAQRYQYIKC